MNEGCGVVNDGRRVIMSPNEPGRQPKQWTSQDFPQGREPNEPGRQLTRSPNNGQVKVPQGREPKQELNRLDSSRVTVRV